MEEPLLKISELDKSYELPVIRSLNLEIYSGQSVALVGANGAGKSTLIKCILGLVYPDKGELLFSGKSREKNSLKNIGYLPEINGFWPELSLDESLSYSARFSELEGERKEERIASLLSVLGLRKRSSKKLGSFSKGMLQRAGLAHMLLHDPDFLILDEPMSGLDPRAQAKVRQILLKLKERGKTLLISSHSLEDVTKLCSRVVVLERGSKVMDGPTAEVLSELQSRYDKMEPWDEDPLGDEDALF